MVEVSWFIGARNNLPGSKIQAQPHAYRFTIIKAESSYDSVQTVAIQEQLRKAKNLFLGL